MSKTLGSILMTAGTLAVAGAAIASGVGALALPGLAGGLSIFGVSTAALTLAGTGLSIVGSLLRQTQAPKPQQTDVAIKTQRPERVAAYGFAKETGSYIA